VVSAVGASVGEAGVSWTLIGLFLWATLHGMECTPARGLLLRFYGFVGPVDTPIWI
jgi:hypothetical protein